MPDKTHPEILDELRAARAEIERRSGVLAAANLRSWRESEDMPRLTIIIPESQRHLDDPVARQLVTEIVGVGRKHGVMVEIHGPRTDLSAYGGSGYIRDQLESS